MPTLKSANKVLCEFNFHQQEFQEWNIQLEILVNICSEQTIPISNIFLQWKLH